MGRLVDSAWKQEVVGSKSGLLDPLLNCVARRRCDLKLHGTLRLLLHDDGSRGDLVAMTDVANLQFHQVAAPELAVNAEIEQRKFTNSVCHLKADPQRPNVLQLEGRLLTDNLSLVPRLALTCDCVGFHDGLQVQLRGSQLRPCTTACRMPSEGASVTSPTQTRRTKRQIASQLVSRPADT
jgi:hypothetical protein